MFPIMEPKVYTQIKCDKTVLSSLLSEESCRRNLKRNLVVLTATLSKEERLSFIKGFWSLSI